MPTARLKLDFQSGLQHSGSGFYICCLCDPLLFEKIRSNLFNNDKLVMPWLLATKRWKGRHPTELTQIFNECKVKHRVGNKTANSSSSWKRNANSEDTKGKTVCSSWYCEVTQLIWCNLVFTTVVGCPEFSAQISSWPYMYWMPFTNSRDWRPYLAHSDFQVNTWAGRLKFTIHVKMKILSQVFLLRYYVN